MWKSAAIPFLWICMLLPACHRNNSADNSLNDVLPSIAYTDEMPSSKFDTLLVGKNRRDVTDVFYQQLSFLPPHLRFFAVYDPAVEPAIGFTFLRAKSSTIFFVVLPNNEVVKFVEAADVSKVGVRITSPQDARALVSFLSGNGEMGRILEATPYFRVKFEDSELFEISEQAQGFTPESLEAAGISAPVVETVTKAGREKYFVVTRFMVPASGRAFEHNFPVPKVVKLTERVSLDGHYSMASEPIATPGLVFHAMITL
jgi:hypothetical protein